MRKYDNEKRRDYFVQGFRIGLVFGIIGALVILGRDNSPQQTLLESGATPQTTETEIETESTTQTITAIEAPPPIPRS